MPPTTANQTTRPKRLAKRLASQFLLVTTLQFLIACAPPRDPVNIGFVPLWENQVLDCTDADKSLSDLRFFVSDIVLIDTLGGTHQVELTADDRWQRENIALVDLEDGTGSCMNGTAETNTHIRGAVARNEFDALRFTVGVPFELNHANPLLATAPLNDSAMHWHWRSGYKFLRAGVHTESDGTWLHLGSTACEGTVQNISGCAAPNRVEVTLHGFTSTTGEIVVDLSALFQGVDLQDSNPSDCSSGPAETECATMFSALGLSFGNAQGEANSVFRIRP